MINYVAAFLGGLVVGGAFIAWFFYACIVNIKPVVTDQDQAVAIAE